MTAKNAKLIALRLLSIKSRTTLELRKKLTLRRFSLQEIDEALSFCREYGYLNDEEEGKRRFAQLKQKGYGPRLIAAKLQAQGLRNSEMSFQDQVAAIQNLIAKPLWKKKEKRNLITALQRRGFDVQCILEVISDAGL